MDLLDGETPSRRRDLCNAGLDQRTLLGEVVERLRRAMPFEAFCVSTMDPSSELITHSIAEGLGDLKETRLFFEHIYLENDVYGYDGTSKSWRQPVSCSPKQPEGNSSVP